MIPSRKPRAKFHSRASPPPPFRSAILANLSRNDTDSGESAEKRTWKANVVLAPVLIIGHFSGLSFYYWRDKRYFRYPYKGIAFSVLVSSLVHELPSIRYWEEYSNGLHGLLVKLETFTWWFSYFTNFFVTSFKNGRINSAIDKLEKCNVFISRTIQIRIIKFNLIHLFANVGMIIVYNVLGHDLVWPNANYTAFTSVIYIIGDFMTFLPFYKFVHIVNLIGELFRQINRNFHRTGNGFEFVGRIGRLRESHLFLTRISAEVNSCFSEQMLLIIFCSMVQSLYAVRSILGDFSIAEMGESVLNVFCDTLWLLPFLSAIIQLIFFCEKTTKEAKKTLTIVHHLMNVHYNDGNTLRELELFALQVQQHPILFNVRFFELQYPFLNTLVSSLMTYFVVIATFQGESNNGYLVNWNFEVQTTAETETSTAEAIA